MTVRARTAQTPDISLCPPEEAQALALGAGNWNRETWAWGGRYDATYYVRSLPAFVADVQEVGLLVFRHRTSGLTITTGRVGHHRHDVSIHGLRSDTADTDVAALWRAFQKFQAFQAARGGGRSPKHMSRDRLREFMQPAVSNAQPGHAMTQEEACNWLLGEQGDPLDPRQLFRIYHDYTDPPFRDWAEVCDFLNVA